MNTWIVRKDLMKHHHMENILKEDKNIIGLINWLTSWKTKNCYAEDVFKTCLKHVFKISLWDFLKACLQDVLETKIWRYLYLTKINGYVSNKSIFHKSTSDDSKAHPKSLIRTQGLQYSSHFEIQTAFLFSELKFLMTVWCCKITWIQIRHCRTRWGSKNEVLSKILDKYI